MVTFTSDGVLSVYDNMAAATAPSLKRQFALTQKGWKTGAETEGTSVLTAIVTLACRCHNPICGRILCTSLFQPLYRGGKATADCDGSKDLPSEHPIDSIP
jgi:hypothetical protein